MALLRKPGLPRWAAFLLALATLPVSALAIDQNENKKEKTDRSHGDGVHGGEGQLRQAGPADLPGPLPGLPPAGQGGRRLRDDGVRPDAQGGRVAASRPSCRASRPRAILSSRSRPQGRQGRDAPEQAAAVAGRRSS